MLSSDLAAVGFDAPTYAELADAASYRGLTQFNGSDAFDELLIYNDPSGARLVMAVQGTEITMVPSFRVETAFWPATAGMIDDLTALVYLFNTQGEPWCAFTALVDEPFTLPFIEASGLVDVCSDFYPELRVAALAIDTEIYPDVSAWAQATIWDPFAGPPEPGELYNPFVEDYLGGATPSELGNGTLLTLQVDAVETRTNHLTGLNFHVATGEIKGRSTPLQVCLSAEHSSELKVGCVIEGAVQMIATDGLWDGLRDYQQANPDRDGGQSL